MPPSKNISFDELSKYFHLPINQVAKELGVCATILKKICRRNGIPRWPHRKIKSLDKMIYNLNVNLEKNPQERDDIIREIELLKSKKLEIMKNPDVLVVGKNALLQRPHSPEDRSVPTKQQTKYRLHDGTPYSYKTSIELETAETLNCFAPTCFTRFETAEGPKPLKSEPAVFTPAPPAPQMSATTQFVFELPRPPALNAPLPTTSFNTLAPPPGVTHNFVVPSFEFHAAYDLPAIRFESKFRNNTLPPIAPLDPRLSYPPPLPVAEAVTLPEWFAQEKDRVFRSNN